MTQELYSNRSNGNNNDKKKQYTKIKYKNNFLRWAKKNNTHIKKQWIKRVASPHNGD